MYSYGYLIFESEGKFDVKEYTDCYEMDPFEGRYNNVWIEDKNGNYVIILDENGKETTITVL
jgi:hypothetical protein